jgi:hypothetical protein
MASSPILVALLVLCFSANVLAFNPGFGGANLTAVTGVNTKGTGAFAVRSALDRRWIYEIV